MNQVTLWVTLPLVLSSVQRLHHQPSTLLKGEHLIELKKESLSALYSSVKHHGRSAL